MDLTRDRNLSKHLIVIITEDLANNKGLAQEVHWLGFNENCPIYYLVLVDRVDNMLTISRNMATMKAVTSANRLQVDFKLILTEDWLETLGKVTYPGDIIICQEEQSVIIGRLNTIPLCEFLTNKFNNSVRTMSGYYHPLKTTAKKWGREIFGYLGLLIIMAGFTWLQISLDQALDNPISTVYSVITFCIELGMILIWYKFAFRSN